MIIKIEELGELDVRLHEITTQPNWIDRCGHTEGSYLFSFVGMLEEGARYDVYVFDRRGRQEFCLRYGTEDGEYCSPGSMENLLSLREVQGCERYRVVVNVLLQCGQVSWTQNKE